VHWHGCKVTVSLLGEEYEYYRKMFKCNKCTGCVCCCVKESRLWKLCEWDVGGVGGASLGLGAAGFYEGVKDFVGEDGVLII
jgi:hypothetical protein